MTRSPGGRDIEELGFKVLPQPKHIVFWAGKDCKRQVKNCPILEEGKLGISQAAQSRKVNNYKDLYGNLDNKLKDIYPQKFSIKSCTLLSW